MIIDFDKLTNNSTLAGILSGCVVLLASYLSQTLSSERTHKLEYSCGETIEFRRDVQQDNKTIENALTIHTLNIRSLNEKLELKGLEIEVEYPNADLQNYRLIPQDPYWNENYWRHYKSKTTQIIPILGPKETYTLAFAVQSNWQKRPRQLLVSITANGKEINKVIYNRGKTNNQEYCGKIQDPKFNPV